MLYFTINRYVLHWSTRIYINVSALCFTTTRKENQESVFYACVIKLQFTAWGWMLFFKRTEIHWCLQENYFPQFVLYQQESLYQYTLTHVSEWGDVSRNTDCLRLSFNCRCGLIVFGSSLIISVETLYLHDCSLFCWNQLCSLYMYAFICRTVVRSFASGGRNMIVVL